MKGEKFTFDKKEVVTITFLLFGVSIVIFGIGIIVGKGLWEAKTFLAEQRVEAEKTEKQEERERLSDLLDHVEIVTQEKEVPAAKEKNFEVAKSESKESAPKKDFEPPLPRQQREDVPPFKTDEPQIHKKNPPAEQLPTPIGDGELALTKPLLPDSFSIQVQAFRTKEKAEQALVEWTAKRPEVKLFLLSKEVPNMGVWYRVMMGEFRSEQEAHKYAMGLGRRGSYVVRRLD